MSAPTATSNSTGASRFQTLTYRRADSGVVYITIDVQDKKVNVLTPQLHQEVGAAASMLAVDEGAIGAVVHSGKSTFMAGGDLNRIVRYYDQRRSAEQAYRESRTYTESLRALETCGKPVAVAINGTALGGGLELALACHHRIVADDEKIRLGLPEVSLGLIPGGGGTQRLPRIIGIEQAAKLILKSRLLTPGQALELGMTDAVMPPGEILQGAEQWVLDQSQSSQPRSSQPWDRKGFRVPGGSGLNDMRIGRLFQQLTASVSAETRRNYPAPIALLRCLFNGTTVLSMDQALAIETREFASLTRDPVARNMIRTLFINQAKTDIKALIAEPRAVELQERCQRAYQNQGALMAESGINPVLINNAAFAAGMPRGPLNGDPADHSANTKSQDAAIIRNRLMCAQALAAAQCWEEQQMSPVSIDLVSHYGWEFPSYTGGVMSFIDTLGLPGFITLCDKLTEEFAAELNPSTWLREQAEGQTRIYPPLP